LKYRRHLRRKVNNIAGKVEIKSEMIHGRLFSSGDDLRLTALIWCRQLKNAQVCYVILLN